MAKYHRGRNEGSISKLPNGTYRAYVSVAPYRRVSGTFHSKDEALNWIRTQLVKQDQGFDFVGSKVTLGEFLSRWMETSRMVLRDKTAHHYNQTIKKRIIPSLGSLQLKDIRLARIEKYYSDLVANRVGFRTIRVIHNILHKALEKAVRYGLLIYNPVHGAFFPSINIPKCRYWMKIRYLSF